MDETQGKYTCNDDGDDDRVMVVLIGKSITIPMKRLMKKKMTMMLKKVPLPRKMLFGHNRDDAQDKKLDKRRCGCLQR